MTRSASLLVALGLVGAGVQGQTPVFRASADFVSRDVLVRDRAGRVVTDLSPRDFEVRENGVAQEIEWFTVIRGGQVVADVVPDAVRTREGLVLPPPTAPAPPARIWMVVIDDLHLQASDTTRVRALLRQIGRDVLAEGDLVAYVSTGPSSIATDLTYDVGHRQLDEAIGKVMGAAPTVQAILQAPSGVNGPAGIRYNAHVAFATAQDLLVQARAIPNRRKALLYVSSGFDFDPFAEARSDAAAAVVRTQNAFAEADLVADLKALIDEANRANVVVHTIDPRGLDAGPPIDAPVGTVHWRRWVSRTTTSLRVLAEETGGIAIVNSNDFATPFQRIVDQMSDYYVIGYTSSNPPAPGKRLVEIAVPSRPGLELRYERSYVRER